MKVLAFNSSPRQSKGATDTVLNKLLEGIESVKYDRKGNRTEIEKIYLSEKNIKQCTGCEKCLTETPGECVIKNDDMPEILDKIRKAGIIIYATPLYCWNMSSDMKIMMERAALPLVKPFLIKDKELTTRPRRDEGPQKKLVILSVCGSPEIESFQALDLCFEQSARFQGAEIIGKIYRPASGFLEGGVPVFEKYLENCRLAGSEIVEHGRITEKTQQELYKDYIMPKFILRFVANMFWKKQVRKHQKKDLGNAWQRLKKWGQQALSVGKTGESD